MAMKLLLITADYLPTKSAEAAHSYHLARKLAAPGVDVHVLTSVGPADGEFLETPGVRIHRVMRSWSWTGLPRLVMHVKKLAPDAVFLMYLGAMYHHDPMITFAATISKRLLPRASFVTQFENSYVLEGPLSSRLVRKIVAWMVTGHGTSRVYGTLLRDSDRVIVLSDRHLKVLTEHYPSIDEKCIFHAAAPDHDRGAQRKRGVTSLGAKPPRRGGRRISACLLWLHLSGQGN